jgi:hypothetical protein
VAAIGSGGLMPRSHARILTSIWDDPDFQVLSVPAQRLYLLLLSQDSLNNAGRILLTVRRWSNGCKATTPADIRKSLAELDAHRFVVVDEDTEEVLVRSFIRNDGILKQPQMMKNALREALAVNSPRLRAVLAAELRKLHREDAALTAEQIDPGWEPDPGPGDNEPSDSPIQAQRSLLEGFGEAAGSGPEDSGESAELRRGRGRGRGSLTSRTTSVSERAKRATRIPEDFAVTQPMVVWARQECPDVDGRYATAQFVDYWTAKAGKDAVKLDWVRTWQTWMRKEQRDASRRGPHLRSVPAALISNDPALAFEDLRERADAATVSRLLGVAYIPKPQPPSDDTPSRVWDQTEARRFIDAHADALRAALNDRSSA